MEITLFVLFKFLLLYHEFGVGIGQAWRVRAGGGDAQADAGA
jgi:hypothetical protein